MLPINKVILFKTGIGCFERQGKADLTKNNSINLSFKRKYMNDILATLSISTKNSMVTCISYEGSEIDLQRALEDALIKIPSENSYISLLKQLIGSQVNLFIAGEKIEGIVLGVQEIKKGIDKAVINEPYLVLNTSDGIKNIKIYDLTGPNSKLSVLDEKMNKELQFFIEKMYTSRKLDMKSLTIFFEGDVEDNINVTYLHEMPSWKVSYRLTFIDDDNFIQGWALIDNTLDEDWEDIELSLIAGLPISFIYDLYTPNWITRPTIARRDKYDIKVTEFEEAEVELNNMLKLEEHAPIPQPTTSASMGYISKKSKKLLNLKIAAQEKKGYNKYDRTKTQARLDSTKVDAKGEESGDFFEYKITVPVTVKRNQSSLVPILQAKVAGKRTSVYNESVRKTNPMLTFEMTNDTGLTLEEGPVTCYEMSTFVGEAMLPFVKKNEKRRIPYSVDLGITVDTKTENKQVDIHKIQLGDSYIYAFSYFIKKCEYIVKNKSEEDREVIIEHPKEYRFELYDTETPFEESKSYFRYKVKVNSKTKAKLTIKTRRVDKSSYYFKNVQKSSIELWFKQKLIQENERDFLLKIWELNSEKNEIDRMITELQNKKNNIFKDQERLRQNLRSIGRTSSEERLRNKYITKMDEQEAQLEKILKEIKDLQIRSQELEKKINEEIRKRPVEG
ncbi:MAG: hypothetical protein ACTSR3_08105 [Candidatus Helarchaeota archaeon]